jgi:hypothetical protein
LSLLNNDVLEFIGSGKFLQQVALLNNANCEQIVRRRFF